MAARGYEEAGGCSFHGQQRRAIFPYSGEQKHVISLLGKQSLSAPSTLLGTVAGEAKKQSKVCLPFPMFFPAACRSSSFSSYLVPGSWAKQRKIWKRLVVCFFPVCPPRQGPAQPHVACLEAGCKRVSQLTWNCKARLLRMAPAPAPCR